MADNRAQRPRETDLYPPVKALLEAQGYEVKGEVGAADVVACKAGEVDPAPYSPRQLRPRKSRLLREFARREGDPNAGGATRVGLVTAYRQDALRIASYLSAHGPCKGAQVAKATGVEHATRMMANDHYGWFERVQRGVYGLTPNGVAALAPKTPGAPGSD